MGRVSGTVDGEVKQGIPNAVAFDDDTVFIFEPSSHVYEVKGTDAGTYRLEIASILNGEATGIGAIDIPIIAGAMHQYAINWEALAQGEEGVTVQIDSDGDGVFERTIASDSELTGDEFVLQTRTTIDFDPDVLNLKSKSQYVTAYVELPPGYDVRQIDISSIRLNGTVPALTRPTAIGDYNNNRIPDLMVKFHMRAVQAILDVGQSVEITITGEVGGIPFMGVDTIRVIG